MLRRTAARTRSIDSPGSLTDTVTDTVTDDKSTDHAKVQKKRVFNIAPFHCDSSQQDDEIVNVLQHDDRGKKNEKNKLCRMPRSSKPTPTILQMQT